MVVGYDSRFTPKGPLVGTTQINESKLNGNINKSEIFVGLIIDMEKKKISYVFQKQIHLVYENFNVDSLHVFICCATNSTSKKKNFFLHFFFFLLLFLFFFYFSTISYFHQTHFRHGKDLELHRFSLTTKTRRFCLGQGDSQEKINKDSS